MSILSTFLGGENRLVLQFLAYPALAIAPVVALVGGIIIPTEKLSSFVRQIISIPLLLAVALIPFGFTNGNKIIDLVVGVTSYNFFLRFVELYWVGPLVQDRPVYASTDSLWVDFWCCMRKFPKPAKKDTPELKKGQVKEFKKDKKFYHIILYMTSHMVVTDVLASWIASFTGEEIRHMVDERPVLFLVYFILVNVLLHVAFNSVGYGLQLFYCIAYEGGSWSSEQWRSLMLNPLGSQSLDELWSYRWHQLFKSTWLAFPFRPVRILVERALTKRVKGVARPVAFLLASISVFAASAFMHEYVVAANVGLPIYKRVFAGEQCIFFIGHGLGVTFEHLVHILVIPRLPKSFQNSVLYNLLGRLWTLVFGYATFFYIANGFVSWGFQCDIPLAFSKPYIADFVHAHPRLLTVWGSRI
ncbi:hypothetical protein [Parasitella parasitica]|uniref:Wax synthase domain-containing protein n=1 Tax=Parasitella parasitica TaxID=35722 RepID=A0A0B7MM05_9FUNG|nr:hypothetical protein [Parasitella parasitica]